MGKFFDFFRKQQTKPYTETTNSAKTDSARDDSLDDEPSGPFSAWHTFGDVKPITFTSPDTGKKKVIINDNGKIAHFPGFAEKEVWIKKWDSQWEPDNSIRYRTSFEYFDEEKYLMLWEIQPDGRYWADDDGFGMENEPEITLYTFINRKGNFMGPFRPYRVGRTKYFDISEEKNK